MNYLRVTEAHNPLNNIFCKNNFNPYELMLEMNIFFRKRDEVSIRNERGDRLRISNTDGTPANCEPQSNDLFYLNNSPYAEEQKIVRFLRMKTKG